MVAACPIARYSGKAIRGLIHPAMGYEIYLRRGTHNVPPLPTWPTAPHLAIGLTMTVLAGGGCLPGGEDPSGCSCKCLRTADYCSDLRLFAIRHADISSSNA